MRHGPAGQRGPEWPDDRLRPLTAKGRAQMQRAAEGLLTLFTPAAIITSPYTRALQTAEILQDAAGLDGLHISDALADGDDATLLRDLNRLCPRDVAVVGHNPYIAETLSLFVAGDASLVTAAFGKGAAALVEWPAAPVAGGGALCWLLPPKALRALAR